MKSTQPQKKVGGITANSFMRPIIAILAVLDIAIIGMFLQINSGASRLSTVMTNVGVYIGEANSLLAGVSLLNQTAANFVLVPVKKTGEFNAAPLTVYANTLSRHRRGSDVLERFRDYEQDDRNTAPCPGSCECRASVSRYGFVESVAVTCVAKYG